MGDLKFPKQDWRDMNVGMFVGTLRLWRAAARVPEKHSELAFWRTLYHDDCVMDPMRKSARLDLEDLAAIEEWWAHMQTIDELTALPDLELPDLWGSQRMGGLLDRCYGRDNKSKTRFCGLDSGRTGICPLGIAFEDEIAVVKGLKYPVALIMERGDSSDEEEGEV